MKRKLLIAVIALLLILIFWQLFFQGAAFFGKAELSWNASTDGDVAGYTVYYGTKPRTGDCPKGGYAKKINAGKNTSYTLNNLTDSADYYFSVTSYNAQGKESCFSQEMHKKINLSLKDKLLLLFHRN